VTFGRSIGLIWLALVSYSNDRSLFVEQRGSNPLASAFANELALQDQFVWQYLTAIFLVLQRVE
jgi:hypothetical protein